MNGSKFQINGRRQLKMKRKRLYKKLRPGYISTLHKPTRGWGSTDIHYLTLYEIRDLWGRRQWHKVHYLNGQDINRYN